VPAAGGLTEREVAARTVVDGPNEWPRPAKRPAIVSLGADLVHFFALMLWVAAGRTWLARRPVPLRAIASGGHSRGR
jgi:magnesium-transporting ATPase (P-type)